MAIIKKRIKEEYLRIAKIRIAPTKIAPATLRYQLYSRIFSGHKGNRQIATTPSTKNKTSPKFAKKIT